MTRILRAAVVLAAIFATAPADAQNRPVVSLQPPDPPRWDVAGQVAWFGTNKSEIAPEWNNWSDSAAFAVSAGYYLTPHLKVDVDAATTTTGEVESLETLEVGGQFPTFHTRRYFFRSTTLSTSLAYQFLENAWFHPFVGVGIEGNREQARIESVSQFVPLPGVRPGTLVPGPPTRLDTTYTARPIVTAGFKWYVSERAFIRGDLRSSFSSDRAESVVWRTGVGFDW